jgi:hypothetical protein
MVSARKLINQTKVMTRRIIPSEISKSSETTRISSPKARKKIILTQKLYEILLIISTLSNAERISTMDKKSVKIAGIKRDVLYLNHLFVQ